MIGAFITNLKLPPSKFQFPVCAYVCDGSKNFTGIGFINYSFYPDGIFRKIDIGVSGSAFTADRFTDDDGNKTFHGFQKVVPGIKLTLKEKNPRSNFNDLCSLKHI